MSLLSISVPSLGCAALTEIHCVMSGNRIDSIQITLRTLFFILSLSFPVIVHFDKYRPYFLSLMPKAKFQKTKSDNIDNFQLTFTVFYGTINIGDIPIINYFYLFVYVNTRYITDRNRL